MKALLILLFFLIAYELPAQQLLIKVGPHAVLTLYRKPFTRGSKTFRFQESNQPHVAKLLIAIDGKPFFGIDGEIPQYQLMKAVLLLNDVSYDLPVDAMYNPWFGSGLNAGLNAESVRLLRIKSIYLLSIVFSDGAGSYRADWRIANGRVKRIKLSADDEFVTDFYVKKQVIK